ncbi:hypothetical protein J3R30DRAFT_919213 [Lentinula aciculospora]|uniref:Uncharacterized protein n=1 Tax=Lentinula aciculospora TaxID=153920 RepID=A0A9W9ARY5_9AGAR|nr:hypothetical protein J3R30DRAFT_919213 [Lentinula aciculospora]
MQVLLGETKKRYMREAELLMSYIHSIGMDTVRGQVGQRPGKTAWLTSQRSNVCYLANKTDIDPNVNFFSLVSNVLFRPRLDNFLLRWTDYYTLIPGC